MPINSDFGEGQMDVIVKAPGDLTRAQKDAWAAIRAANPALYSPYFHIEYSEAVAKARGDINVLILMRAGKPAAFLPLQGKGFARPAGAPFTDYHGVIAPEDLDFDIAAMLKAGDIGALHFDAWVEPKAKAQTGEDMHCAVIDVSAGGPAWREGKGGSYRRHLKGLRRRIKKSSEFGAPRMEFKSRDSAAFEQLIAWKRAQYLRTGKYDVLGANWTRGVLKDLFESQSELRADMHVLYFGDKIAAIDLGLTDGEVYHSWITAYDPDYRNVSPGMQLFERLIDEASPLGYQTIDLGAGLDGYKHHYADAHMGGAIRSGFIAARGPAAALSRLYGAAESFGEKKKLGGLGPLPGKIRRRYSQIAACDDSFSGRAKAMLSAVKGAPKAP
ncbi:MAG: GNAT family N-acetyltransferase [Robiginitomaculum sp.]